MSDDLRITEGVSGLWHYHLSRPGEWKGLCGASIMNTNFERSDWKLASFGQDWPKKPTYCARCDRLADTAPGAPKGEA